MALESIDGTKIHNAQQAVALLKAGQGEMSLVAAVPRSMSHSPAGMVSGFSNFLAGNYAAASPGNLNGMSQNPNGITAVCPRGIDDMEFVLDEDELTKF